MGGEITDDGIDGIFRGGRADNDETLAGVFDLDTDHIPDATHEGENENNTSDADGDAKAGEERAPTVSGDLIVSEAIMSAKEKRH